MNLSLLDEEAPLFKQLVLASLSPLVEMFQEVVNDERLLRSSEAAFAAILTKLGIDSKAIGRGWLYPCAIDHAPAFVLFSNDPADNWGKERDDRWHFSACGRKLYQCLPGRKPSGDEVIRNPSDSDSE